MCVCVCVCVVCVCVCETVGRSLFCVYVGVQNRHGTPSAWLEVPLGRAFILGAECRFSAGLVSGESLKYPSFLTFTRFHVFSSPPQMSVTPAFDCHLLVSSLVLPAVLK